ncbi:hypothetical protein D910_00454 [Dendroctonus ponderosae]|uniref:Reverse transcriptase domain-containing protein n=1 Tax=Dendroctonus ponderosae TaxID=77166 RepID=U4TRW5_DENPD|nr:hypothetical protein D910_00454 [Dendroctonus ponderosae]
MTSQINLNRCRIAHDLLERITKDDKINVVIGQEPYGKSLIDYHDDNRDSFINVDNKYKVLKSGCGEGFVHVELSNCVVISCYFSPNGNVADFERLLQNMKKVIRHGGKQVVMGGDLNAKTNLIGSKTTNQRGAILQDWILTNGLVILNEGDTPTFQNANGTSIIDFTVASEQLSRRVGTWRVEPEIENFSDHHNIRFEIQGTPGETTPRLSQTGWSIKPAAITELTAAHRKHPDEHTTIQQIKKLFPIKTLTPRETGPGEWYETPLFNIDELKAALKERKKRKAPGLDGISLEVLRACITETPMVFLKLLNDCLQKAEFPAAWKRARLVLTEKPKKDPQGQTSYRPLCLIDELGKIFEALIKNRLEDEMRKKGLEHVHQYGFTKGKSTTSALLKIKEIADNTKKKAYQHREICIMILMDVQNAFNSAPWDGIIQSLSDGGISRYIVEIVKSYLWDRSIVTAEGEIYPVTCGVPQGSILGPKLWNIFYNKILNVDIGKGVETVAYADDLALVVTGKTPDMVKTRATQAIQRVSETLRGMGIKVAPEKTESVLLTAPRKIPGIVLDTGERSIATSDSVRYLGVMLDRNVKMKAHIRRTVEKANKMITLLYRLMPRVGGPKASKRRALAGTVISAALYGAPMWHQTLKYQHYSNLMTGINRKLATMITSAYKTVPTIAIEAIAGTIPLDLLVRERVEMQTLGSEHKANAREATMRAWQDRFGAEIRRGRLLHHPSHDGPRGIRELSQKNKKTGK